MEREIGYKVVRVVPIDHADPKRGVKLMSYTTFNLTADPDFDGLEYGIGIETRPREGDGLLACFAKMHYVRKFFANEKLSSGFERSNFRVYKCKLVRDTTSAWMLWIKTNEHKVAFPLSACPHGTILCDMIALTEEVKI